MSAESSEPSALGTAEYIKEEILTEGEITTDDIKQEIDQVHVCQLNNFCIPSVPDEIESGVSV